MAKYDPLRDHLATRTGPEVRMTFAEIESLVGPLPPTARTTRQWWANSSNVQAQGWQGADWHVHKVDFDAEQIVFQRGRVGGTRLNPTPAPSFVDLVPVLTDHLVLNGWRTLVVDVPDNRHISALKDGRTLAVVATGPGRARDAYAEAVLSVMLEQDGALTTDFAVALPDRPDYRDLYDRTSAGLALLGIRAYFVKPDGSVDEVSERSDPEHGGWRAGRPPNRQ